MSFRRTHKVKPFSIGEAIFTSSGFFIVPKNVNIIEVFVVGGGAGGSANGGGGGYTKTERITVNPGDKVNVTIGAGGLPNYGGNTSIVNTVVALGGNMIRKGVSLDVLHKSENPNGGCGGGAYSDIEVYAPGNGGYDGKHGGIGHTRINGSTSIIHGGRGQEYTSKAFRKFTGTTLYGGGGGGQWVSGNPHKPASGGIGGGGNGGVGNSDSLIYAPTDGKANTGGGGGGMIGYKQAKGGSGIVIIKW